MNKMIIQALHTMSTRNVFYVTESQGGDARGLLFNAKSQFLVTKVAPPRGEFKSKKASKVTETHGGDMRGLLTKAKS